MDAQKDTGRAGGARGSSKGCAIACLLCACIFAFTFTTRYLAEDQMTLQGKHSYLYYFCPAINAVCGYGFTNSKPADGRTQSVESFLYSRQGVLNDSELLEYKGSLAAAGRENLAGLDQFQRSRILDIYSAGLVWKLFGVSWKHYFTLYNVLSAACAVLLFLLCRQVTGSCFGATVAALVYAVTPLELQNGVWSIRDTSPLWCGIISFWAMVRAGRQATFPRRMASFFLFGMLAFVGIGWRVDAYFTGAALCCWLVVLLAASGYGVKEAAANAGAAVCGVVAFYCIVFLPHSFSSNKYESIPTVPGVIGYYAESTRLSAFGYENTFGIIRDDWHVADVATLLRDRYGFSNETMGYAKNEFGAPSVSKGFDVVSRIMWRDVMRHNASTHAANIAKILTSPPQLTGYAHAVHMPYQQKLLELLDACVQKALPFLLPCSLLFLLVLPRGAAIHGLAMASFYASYIVLYYLMLPEQKHLSVTLLPLSVLAALGATGILRVFSRSSREEFLRTFHVRWKLAFVCVLALGVFCLAVQGTCASISATQRKECLAAIAALEGHGVDAGGALLSRDCFFVSGNSSELTGPRMRDGYLLKLRSDGLEHAINVRLWSRYQLSWPSGAVLPAGVSTAWYFHTFLEAPVPGVVDAVAITVPPGVSIESCTRYDLSGWGRLPYSTLFYDGQDAGAPRFFRTRNAAEAFPQERLALRDFLKELPLDVAAPAPLPPLASWKSSGQPGIVVDRDPQGGLEVLGDASQTGYQVLSPAIAVAPGTQYKISLPLWCEGGKVALGVLGEDNAWLVSPGASSRIVFNSGPNRSITLVVCNSYVQARDARRTKFRLMPGTLDELRVRREEQLRQKWPELFGPTS